MRSWSLGPRKIHVLTIQSARKEAVPEIYAKGPRNGLLSTALMHVKAGTEGDQGKGPPKE